MTKSIATKAAPVKSAPRKAVKTTKAVSPLVSALAAQAPKRPASQKPGKAVLAVALPVKLEVLALEISGAILESNSLSTTLGALVQQAGKLIKTEDLIAPFLDACKQFCLAADLTEGSFKVYLANIRGVLRAMVTAGYKPAEGMGLRGMYDGAPKGMGRQAAGSQAGKGAKAAPVGGDMITVTPAQAKALDDNAAVTRLFGTCNDELMTAVKFAATHTGQFMHWVSEQVKLEQVKAVEDAIAQVGQPNKAVSKVAAKLAQSTQRRKAA